MPNDAKLGLVVGVALVLLIAVLFFRREQVANLSGHDATAAVIPAPALPTTASGPVVPAVLNAGETR
jgi:hypothetical protein